MTRRLWPAAVPVAWCAAVLALMRPDAIRATDDLPAAVKWLLYDETDLAALALRGANAHAGRPPGRRDEPVRDEFAHQFADRLDAGPPLADRYYLEYPVPALAVFRLGYAFRGADPGFLPHAAADAEQFWVGQFVPRTDAERVAWGHLRAAVRFYVVLTAAALVGIVVVLAQGYGPGLDRGAVWLCALPAAVFFALNRFDVLPAFLTALAFAALGHRRPAWAGVWMAVAVLLKLYPVLFVPVVLRHLGPRRDGVKFATALAAVLAAGAGLSVGWVGWEGAVGPVLVQLSRPLETGWTLYGLVLPEPLGTAGGVRLGLVATAVLAAVVTRPADLRAVLRRCALVLLPFVALAVFWSPQWVLWFLPLLVPLADRSRGVLAAAVGLDLVNYLSFPVLFWVVWERLPDGWGRAGMAALVVARAALYVALAVVLIRDERREGEPGS